MLRERARGLGRYDRRRALAVLLALLARAGRSERVELWRVARHIIERLVEIEAAVEREGRDAVAAIGPARAGVHQPDPVATLERAAREQPGGDPAADGLSLWRPSGFVSFNLPHLGAVFSYPPGMPVPGSRRRGPERLLVGGFEVTPHGLFIGAVIGGLVAAAALLCIFHFTKPKPKKRKPVLAVDFDEVCVGYLAAFIEFNNETYGTTLVFADFET